MKFQDLPMKTLVQVLKDLRGGKIGFDYERDERTKTKTAMIQFILAGYSNDQITAAVERVMAQATQPQQTAPSVDPLAALEAIKEAILNPPKAGIDADAVKAIVEASVADLRKRVDSMVAPVRVEVVNPVTSATVNCGVCHKHFPVLLKMLQARMVNGNRLNIWLKGPAGSGKTTAAEKVAEALGLQFQFNGAISTEYELMGFIDASGKYHRTAFREIFENGGVYLFDEVDSSLPKAVLAFNAALANGVCRFPDGMVKRHPDCVIIAGANTAGNGATSEYVGRMKQDLAFLNRFVLLDWPHDEALETALAVNSQWVKRVQTVRAKVDARGIKGHIVSSRATFYGEALLAAGVDMEFVEAGVLKGAMTADQWNQVC